MILLRLTHNKALPVKITAYFKTIRTDTHRQDFTYIYIFEQKQDWWTLIQGF